MSLNDRDGTVLLVFAGIGIGVLCGALIGVIAGRRYKSSPYPDVAESVSDLRARAEQVLSELSASVSSIEARNPLTKSNIQYAPAIKMQSNGAGEVMG